MIDWQNARIAHMAKDNGYNDGFGVGKKQWNRENYPWILSLECSGRTNDGSLSCPGCREMSYPSYLHKDNCPLAKYLKENEPS